MGLFNNSNQILAERALDAVWYKQRVISNNISNVDTPGFKAKTVDFKLLLNEKRKCRYRPLKESRSGEGGLSDFKVVTSQRADTNQILDGNNVDMEKEALALADAQYQYSALIDRLNNDYRMIRSALVK
ncbi:MAG: flagellar basal body rod protein FlgB [Oscillospiraceae bacterium]|nr:flagellar basal body rod protein FlgB [Oscillospiraceae bacterium]